LSYLFAYLFCIQVVATTTIQRAALRAAKGVNSSHTLLVVTRCLTAACAI
jgi:hypothetical protein